MQWKTRSWLAAIAVMTLMLAACGDGNGDTQAGPDDTSSPADGGTETPEEPAEAVTMRIGGAGAGSAAFVALGGLAEYVNTQSGLESVRITNQATGGNTENLRLLAQGEIEMVHTNTQPLKQALTATGPFADDDPEQYQDIRLLMPLWFSPTAWYTYDESIESVADLAGKRVNVGPPGSGLTTMAENALRAAGIYDQVQIEHEDPNEATRLLQDGLIDAFSSTGPPPIPSVSEAAAGGDLRLIPMGDEVIAEMDADDTVMPQTIPAGAYGPETPAEDYETVGWAAYLTVRADFPEDIAYQLMEVLTQPEAHEYLIEQWSGFALALGDNFQPGFGAIEDGGGTLHPAAVRYWEEQGEEVPDSIKP